MANTLIIIIKDIVPSTLTFYVELTDDFVLILLLTGMIFRPFGSDDPRLKVALETAEPLIHFALVCGAKSCPPIKTYSASGIMDQVCGFTQHYSIAGCTDVWSFT